MTLPPHDLKCPTDPMNPQPVGIDDRTGFKVYLDRLQWQFDYRGNQLSNLRIRVKDPDKPFEHYRPIIVGPDPIPPRDPRPYSYASQMGGGQPPLLDPNTIYPDFDTAPVLFATEAGTLWVGDRGTLFMEGS